MELRHLRYFVAVAEALSYRKAAARLHIAAPAISGQIKDLEADLEVQLLDRDTGGVRLTDAGAAFLEQARHVLADAEQAGAVARDAAKGERGHLRVAYFAPILMGFMPASLQAFHKRSPGVEVTLIEMPLSEQITAIEIGTVQIGFTICKGTDLPCRLRSTEIVRTPMLAVMGREHRLARETRVSLADLANEPLAFVTAKKGAASVHAELMRRVFAARGLATGPLREVVGTEAFRARLEGGLIVSLITAAGSLARSEDLVVKPLRETGPDLFAELHALWCEERKSQMAMNFVAVMRAVAPREMRRALTGERPKFPA
jgi:DNA-binding transcriptional LysR family regulator